MRAILLSLVLLGAATPLQAEDKAFAPESWGAEVPAQSAVQLTDALASFSGTPGEAAVYQGRIVDVCEKRGCWAELEMDGKSARVRPRDYGFMVPRDVRGEAKVYGVLELKDLSEARANFAKENPNKPNPIPETEFYIDALGIVMVE